VSVEVPPGASFCSYSSRGRNDIEIGISPIAFTIGPVSVHWYGIMVALAVATLVVWCWYFTRNRGITAEFVMGAALVLIPTGIIVSRLVHILDKLGYYWDNPRAILSLEGMTIYGAILGGLLAGWVYCRLKRVTFAPLADLAAPGIIMAQAIGRVGCILNGCCTGKETSLPWAFVYTNPLTQATMYDPATGQVVSALYVPLHPTHLYELLGDLLIFVLLFWVFRGRLKPDGSLLALYLALYSALTFTVRFWRGDTTPVVGFVPEGQLISVILFVGSVAWMVAKKTHWVRKQDGPAAGEAETKASVGGNAG